MPQLKKVVLATGNRLIYRDTFKEALAELTGGPASAAPALAAVTSAPAPAATQQAYPRSLNVSVVFWTRPNNWSGSWRR
jgi:uncharacterized membrane protein (UPF0182 family)